MGIIENIGERVKLQRITIEVDPAHVFAQGLIAIPHIEHPGKTAGVQHAADQRLYQPRFTCPGGAADRHIEVGVIHPFIKKVDIRQLVAVGRRQQTGRGQRAVGHHGQKIGDLERFGPFDHPGRLQLSEQSLTGFEGQHGQKVTQVMVAGRDQLETAFTKTVQHLLFGGE